MGGSALGAGGGVPPPPSLEAAPLGSEKGAESRVGSLGSSGPPFPFSLPDVSD